MTALAEMAKVKICLMGGDEHDIETPLDMRAREFLEELTSALNLPRTDHEGHPVAWRIDDKDTGRTLDLNKELGQNGVKAGHRLSLFRQVTAGKGGI